jgi:acyl-[acyl-carrier-protein]-phospholipid O-acyltransferase / long-chain-fatty-acid--[acyl-carrier-protein] ligase
MSDDKKETPAKASAWAWISILGSMLAIGAVSGLSVALIAVDLHAPAGLFPLLVAIGTLTGLAFGLRRATGHLEVGMLAWAPAVLGLLLIASSPFEGDVAALLFAVVAAFLGAQAALALGPGAGRGPYWGLSAALGVLPGIWAARLLAGAPQVRLQVGVVCIIAALLLALVFVGPATRAFFLQIGPLLYRVRTRGLEHLPQEGSALIVCNHVSFVDWWLIGLAARRPMRSIIDRGYYENPYFRWLLDAHGAIPVDSTGSAAKLLRSLRDAGNALDEGELVCIFAEGQIGRLGQVLPFQRGLERMLKGRDIPVIPAHLEGLAGSRFAPRRGHETFRPAGWRRQVTAAFGTELPTSTSAEDIRHAVLRLEHESWMQKGEERRGVHSDFHRRARRAPRAIAVREDGQDLSRLQLFVGALALARRLRHQLGENEPVALLLPPGRAAALTSLATSLSGRVLLPLNPSAGAAAIAAAVHRGGARRLITSPRLLEALKIELPAELEPLMIEDLFGEIGGWDRALGLLALLTPLSWAERLAGAPRGVRGRDRCALLFTSGSSGTPKGVPLTHAQVAANVEQVTRVLPLDATERLLGNLPLFHAFGLMVQWLSLSAGFRFVTQVNPLDASAVGRLVESEGLTLMVATPTFLGLYLRRCSGPQFGSLRHVVAGAERLAPELASAFEDKFGIAPLEGYGATECAPVIAVSTVSFRGPSVFQRGNREGSVGRPLPGLLIRTQDPETETDCAQGESGHLLVRGPNVMNGYLNDPARSAEALQDGWYRTGDLGRVDDEGLIAIEDRIARFSKIGGEMVPHGRVEEELQRAAGRLERAFAITSVADAKKGERLVLFHVVGNEELDQALAGAKAAGLPNLFLPRREDCRALESLPMLPSGKLDLAQLKKRAREA